MILSVIGARPQFVKAAVVSKALAEAGIMETVVHTGQHYDERMSAIFWEELDMPRVEINLECGSGNQGAQTASIIAKLEAFILGLQSKPKGVLVYGDTNSTLAAAIVCSKLQIPVMHVEAGLRSFNKTMPEEINRIVTDHLSSILFCSSDEGVNQLKNEGITRNVYDVGDVMYDAIVQFSPISQKKINLKTLLPFSDDEFCLLTLHRPVNTDSQENVRSILLSLGQIKMPVLWPVHPRVKNKLDHLAIPENVHIIEPVSYFEMLAILKKVYKVFTDSGGLQKEVYWLKRPCITLRNETEWVETLHNNWNILTGPSTNKIIDAFEMTIDETTWVPLYGQGDAGKKIVEYIKMHLS